MKVSVALCTFNGEKYLAEQLDSILRQSRQPDEIVICDDASTDSTWAMLERYQKSFQETVKLYLNETNLGYVRNFERAISRCSGEIIFLSDQDDLWKTDKIEKTFGFFRANPAVSVVAHDLAIFDLVEKDQTFWEMKKFSPQKQKLSQMDLLRFILVNGNVFPGMSLAMRKSAAEKYVPLKKADDMLIHDYEIVVKALRDETFSWMPEILGSYRLHEAQAIGAREKPNVLTCGLKEIQQRSEHYLRLRAYTKTFGLPKSIAADYRRDVRKKYRHFLRRFPWPQRLLVHLKNKYYYKILHF